MKSYTLGLEGIDFFHLTLEQQLALHEWVQSNGFALNWVCRLDVSRVYVVVHTYVWFPDGKGGFVRKFNAADDNLQTERHRISSAGFPHPDLAESLRGAHVARQAYENQLHVLRDRHRELQERYEVRGRALKRLREEMGRE